MLRVAAPLMLVGARARRRPARWLWPAVAVAVTVAAGGALAAEAVIAADQAARSALAAAPPLQRSIRITWQGPSTPAASREAVGVLSRLGTGPRTDVVLLNPVRLSGVIVRPVAISPLRRWLPAAAHDRLGPCTADGCRMLLARSGRVPARLNAAGVHISLAGRDPLTSDVPLGFATAAEGSWPLVVTPDTVGLERLAGLSGVYRVSSWLAPLSIASLHSWQLASLESRLSAARESLLVGSQQFGFDAPFAAIDAARAAASSAPSSLALVGGSAVVVAGLFVLLAAAGLGPEQRAELRRLELAGATTGQTAAFVAGEAALLAAVAVLAGFALALLAASGLAAGAGEPVGEVLRRSVLGPAALPALLGCWLLAVALLIAAAFARHRRLLDVAAVGGALVLVAALELGTGGGTAWSEILAPLACVAAGVLVLRGVGALFGVAERLGRSGPLTVRLALIGLARNRGLPAFAVAFVAVGVGLGGFALGYRATLARGAADQAAQRVPLDALIAPGPSLRTPLDVASLARWRAIAGGTVLPVRSTQASYPSGIGFVTVPAIGVPAAGLALIHGWRASDAPAPLGVLARRLIPPGPVRTRGPRLPPGTRTLSIAARSPDLGLTVTADLRDPAGDVRRLPLGTAGAHARELTARVPAGSWEVEAIEVDELSGVTATNGHQNGENPAATTQASETVSLGPLSWRGGSRPGGAGLGWWVGVGALATGRGGASGLASGRSSRVPDDAVATFSTSGLPGILRPVQPSDRRPVPVLADPNAAAAAGPGGLLAMTVDGLPVNARVVGVLRRFPTVPPGAGGFIVADQAELASALDAQLPGQGRPDQLWIATAHPAALRTALRSGPLASLTASFRADIQRALAGSPIARAVSRTLLAMAVLTTALSVLGVLLVVLGPLRDPSIERDLEAQGLGPGALRGELVARVSIAGGLGVVAGVAIAVGLCALAVRVVAGAEVVVAPSPSLVTVVPWAELAVWALAVAAVLVLAALVSSRTLYRDAPRPRPGPPPVREPEDVVRMVAR